MSEPYHEPVYYLYENALAQIVGMIELCRREDPATLADMVPRIREIANSGLMHDFKAIYPGHTDAFHASMEREIFTGPPRLNYTNVDENLEFAKSTGFTK